MTCISTRHLKLKWSIVSFLFRVHLFRQLQVQNFSSLKKLSPNFLGSNYVLVQGKANSVKKKIGGNLFLKLAGFGHVSNLVILPYGSYLDR